MKKKEEIHIMGLFLFVFAVLLSSAAGISHAAIPNSSFGEMVDGVSETLADGARTAVKMAKSGLEALDERLERDGAEKNQSESTGETHDEKMRETNEAEKEVEKTEETGIETDKERTVSVRTVFYISTGLFLLVLIAGFLTFEPLVLVFAGFLGAISVILKIFV